MVILNLVTSNNQHIISPKKYDFANHISSICLTQCEMLPSIPCFAECSLKLILNAISTGAHVIKGCIFKNRMIDVKVSNNKLFHRSLRIIAEFAKCSEETAQEALLK